MNAAELAVFPEEDDEDDEEDEEDEDDDDKLLPTPR